MPVRSVVTLSCAALLALAGVVTTTPAGAAPPASAAASAAAPADHGRPAPDLQTEAVPGELVVGYVEGAAPVARDRARGRAQAVLAEQVVPGEAVRREVELVRLPRGKDRGQAIAELQSDPAVAYAEPNFIYRRAAVLTDTVPWGMQSATATAGTAAWNVHGSQASKAWGTSTGSAAVYVGVIDEGIQVTHPDLDANVGNPLEKAGNRKDDDGNGYRDDTHGWDFVGNNNTVYDGGTSGSSDSHGTHVAGTIGAEHDGAGVAGLNASVKLISAKFLGPSGGSLANAVKAVDYFTNLKLKVGLNVVATNNSWGGGGFSSSLNDAIGRGAKAGILFVAAAGNDGKDNDSGDHWPSDYRTVKTVGVESVISVAAIDEHGGLASFSNYGTSYDGVTLGAPGVAVLSTVPFNKHATYSGTSMATPHVTGAAALYAAAKSHGLLGTEQARMDQMAAVRNALVSSTAPTDSLRGTVCTGGRLDAAAALTAALTAAPASPPAC